MLKALNETNMVIGSIIRFEMIPAMMLMSMKSIKSIDGWCSSIHNIFAITAKNRDKTSVRTNDE